jgi:hypothetical protein
VAGGGPFGSGLNTATRTQRAVLQARDNLSFDDDGSNSILSFTALDARVVNIDEEFFGASTASWQYPWRQFNISGSSTTANQVVGGDAWPNLGVISISTGTTSGNGFSIAFTNNVGATGALGALGANSGWGYLWVFKLNAASSVRMRIGTGVVDSVTIFDRNGMMGLRYDTNLGDTGFQFFMRGASGNDVLIDSGVAGDSAWHTLLVYSTITGTVRMSLDAGTEKTFCSSGCDANLTVPVVQMDPLAQVLTDTAAARTLFLDAFKFKARVATGAGNKRN